MFRLGRKATKKLRKPSKDAEKASKATEEPTPLKIEPEYNSELAQARAKAFKKNHVVQEKGLPSFAEFGTRDMDDEYSDDASREPTFKPGLQVPGHGDPRLRSARHSDGSDRIAAGTPSPQFSPYYRNSGEFAPTRYLSPALSRHSSPLAEMDNYHRQTPPSPMPFRSAASPAPHNWIAQPAPVPGIDWERRDTYNPFDAVSWGAPTPAPRALDERTIYDQAHRVAQNQWAHLAPNHPYRPPSSLYDPTRQPFTPPPPREAEVPFYPSPVSDRYGYAANDSQTSFDQGWTSHHPSPGGPKANFASHSPSHSQAHHQTQSWTDLPPSSYSNEGHNHIPNPYLPNSAWQDQSRGPSPIPPQQSSYYAEYHHEPSHPHQRAHTVDVTYAQRGFSNQNYSPHPHHTRFPTEPINHHAPHSQSWDNPQQRIRTKSLHSTAYGGTPAPPPLSPAPAPPVVARPHRYSDVGQFQARKPPPDVATTYDRYSPHQQEPLAYGGVDSITEQMGRTRLSTHGSPHDWAYQQQRSRVETSAPSRMSAAPAASPTAAQAQRDWRTYSASPSPMSHSSSASSWETSNEREFLPQSAPRTSTHSFAEEHADPHYEPKLQAISTRLVERRQSQYIRDVEQKQPPAALSRQKTRLPDRILPTITSHEQELESRSNSRPGRKSMSYSQPLAGGEDDEECLTPLPHTSSDSPGSTHQRSSASDSSCDPPHSSQVRSSAPSTPHRRRTIVLNGPKGPRSPAGRVSLGMI